MDDDLLENRENPHKTSYLSMSRKEAENKIQKQIMFGTELLKERNGNQIEFDSLTEKFYTWSEYNEALLRNIIDTNELVNTYDEKTKIRLVSYKKFENDSNKLESDIKSHIRILESIKNCLEFIKESPKQKKTLSKYEIGLLRVRIDSLMTFITNVQIAGTAVLLDNQARKEFDEMYSDIEEILGDPNLQTYAPPLPHLGTTSRDQLLLSKHQLLIINYGTRLIKYVEGVLNSFDNHRQSATNIIKQRKIFISHGTESQALSSLEEFISALGFIPVIAKKNPSHDQSLNQKIEELIRTSDAVIILATGDDKITGDDKLQPRQNVIHEIGLAQVIHQGRIIYLLEENTIFPSNIKPKVYSSFSKDNLANSFIDIVREFVSYGFF